MQRMKQVLIRVSDPDEDKAYDTAHDMAQYAEYLFNEEGSTIMFGFGRWKGEQEFAATIEVVTTSIITSNEIGLLQEQVRSLGQETAFITVNDVEADV